MKPSTKEHIIEGFTGIPFDIFVRPKKRRMHSSIYATPDYHPQECRLGKNKEQVEL